MTMFFFDALILKTRSGDKDVEDEEEADDEEEESDLLSRSSRFPAEPVLEHDRERQPQIHSRKIAS